MAHATGLLAVPWARGCRVGVVLTMGSRLQYPAPCAHLAARAAMNYFFQGGNIVISYSGPGSKQFKTT